MAALHVACSPPQPPHSPLRQSPASHFKTQSTVIRKEDTSGWSDTLQQNPFPCLKLHRINDSWSKKKKKKNFILIPAVLIIGMLTGRDSPQKITYVEHFWLVLLFCMEK